MVDNSMDLVVPLVPPLLLLVLLVVLGLGLILEDMFILLLLLPPAMEIVCREVLLPEIDDEEVDGTPNPNYINIHKHI